MNYFKQIWYEMLRQPLVTGVTVMATALSIFLIMSLYMISRVNVVDTVPETNRSRTLYAPYIHIVRTDGTGDASGNLSLSTAHTLYDNLEGVERYSYGNGWNATRDVNVKNGVINSLETKEVDNEFWNMYDFKFVAGRPFSKEQVDAGEKVAVVTERTARILVDGGDILGRDIFVDHLPFRVVGVVENSSSLLKNSYSEIYVPFKEDPSSVWQDYLGSVQLTMLLKKDVSVDAIKKEVERRYKVWSDQHKKEGREALYHGLPYTTVEMAAAQGSNGEPTAENDRRNRLLMYALLLLVPAFNLSGMTRSRLARRVSEIGVRRAFGATRFGIFSELVTENFFLTLIGGVVGLLMSILFITCFSHLFINYLGWDISASKMSETPAFNMFFSWWVFMVILVSCFILNLLCTGIPAWKAAHVNPAEAISSRRG